MTFTIQNGTLTLTKTDLGLEPLVLFFDVLIESDTLVITNARQGEPANNQVTISGQTAALDDTSQVELTYYADSGALLSLKIIQPLTEFDGLALPGISFSKLEHHFHITVPEAGSTELANLWRELTGEFNVGSRVTIPFKITNPVASQTLLIETAFEPDNAPGLTDLAHLFGTTDKPEQDLEWLPEELRDTKLIVLRDLQFKLDPAEAKRLSMVSVTADLVPDHLWPIIPGSRFLSIGNLWISMDVDYPLEADYRFPIVQFGGSIKIGEAANDGVINVVARWPDFAISGNLAEGQNIKIGQLLRELNLPLADLPQGNDELVIDKLAFSAEPTTTPKRYTFSINITNLWLFPLPGNTTLTIDELSFFIDYTGPSADTTSDSIHGSTSNTAVTLLGKLTIADVDLTMVANHVSADSGWDFAGSTGTGQQIPIGSLIDFLVKKFGAISPPTEISNLTIENLRLTFNTRSKDFTFSGETQLPIGADPQQTVDAIIVIEIRHQTDGSFSKRFSGQFEVAELAFDLIFESERQTTTTASQALVAAYRDPKGHPVNIDDLINLVGLDDVTTGLSITIKEALAAYVAHVNGTGSQTSRWLFGISIDGHLNLSALKIDELPLIGATLSAHESLMLDLGVLIPSKPFTVDEINRFNSLVSNGTLSLPPKAINQLNLAANLRVGADSKQFDVPLGQELSPAGGASQTSPATDFNRGSTPGAVGDITSPDGVHWVKLQKTIGPLDFQQLGMRYREQRIHAYLDAALTAHGLTIGLSGLSVSSRIDKFQPAFSLNDLAIDYRNGPVEIGGSFLKVADGFAGLAIVRTETLTLGAIGVYANLQRHPSLFVYTVLDTPLGGPAFFFVTGLAAGFGYNRLLQVPPVDQITTFPLVQEAVGGLAGTPNLADELTKLQHYIPPSLGNVFLAIGIRFTSFKMIDSFILLSATFGHRFELDVVGLSTLVLPATDAESANVTPIAEVQLALRAAFIPEDGFLGVSAQLTPNSFLLSRRCHLTGGFAFYAWFAGIHDGDFVLTVGGYHPHFSRPRHYPLVPRLGFNWQVNDQVTFKGSAYYALTASAIMAGCRLSATWHDGRLRAWFEVGLNVLISWKPYHYEADFYIDFGVAFTFHVFGTHHITVHLGANLDIWGPEFAGKAHIHLYILSFTIHFGARDRSQLKPIPWSQFRQSFLPTDLTRVCTITLKAGLIDRQAAKDSTETGRGDLNDLGVVNPKTLCVTTDSVIPLQRAYAGSRGQSELDRAGATTSFQIGTMQVKSDELVSTLRIFITCDGNAAETAFEFHPRTKNAPAALWGARLKPALHGEQMVHQLLTGYEIHPKRPTEAPHTAPIPYATLQQAVTLDREDDAFRWSPLTPFVTQALGDLKARQEIDDTLTNPDVARKRAAIHTALFDNSGLELAGLTAHDFFSAPHVRALTPTVI